MFKSSLHSTNKLQYLTIFDVVVLAVLFFGWAIYQSTLSLVELLNAGQSTPEQLVFDEMANWMGIATELGTLLLVFAYLWCRRFDFGRLNFRISYRTLQKILLYILLAGTVATIVDVGHAYWAMSDVAESTSGAGYTFDEHFAQISPSLVLFALVNGFYEELFFVGLAVLAKKQHLPIVFLMSLVVRFLFHTYQGFVGAFVIMTLGVVFFYLRQKDDELVPFMLAHAFFDVFGLGLPLYWLE